MYFDTHAHYDDKRYDPDREQLLGSMKANGVTLILNPGASMDSSETAVRLAETYDFMYAAVGVHPHDAADMQDSDLARLSSLAKGCAKVRAIGEIGLDYYRNLSPKEVQHRRFRDQMALARELGLPVIIHDRDAHEDCLSIIREFPDVRGVYHCYSGSLEYAKLLISIGYSVSFTGTLTFKGARHAVETAAWLPEDKVMIETDAPYLTPEPHRGGRNDSTYVRFVCQKLADIRGVSLEEMAARTMQNGKAFFDIK